MLTKSEGTFTGLLLNVFLFILHLFEVCCIFCFKEIYTFDLKDVSVQF